MCIGRVDDSLTLRPTWRGIDVRRCSLVRHATPLIHLIVLYQRSLDKLGAKQQSAAKNLGCKTIVTDADLSDGPKHLQVPTLRGWQDHDVIEKTKSTLHVKTPEIRSISSLIWGGLSDLTRVAAVDASCPTSVRSAMFQP